MNRKGIHTRAPPTFSPGPERPCQDRPGVCLHPSSPWHALARADWPGGRKRSRACRSLTPRIPWRVAVAWTRSSCLHTSHGWCKQFRREPAWHSESGRQLSFVPVVNPFALHKRWKIGLCCGSWLLGLRVKESFFILLFLPFFFFLF